MNEDRDTVMYSQQFAWKTISEHLELLFDGDFGLLDKIVLLFIDKQKSPGFCFTRKYSYPIH